MLYAENVHFTKRGIVFTDKDGRELSITNAIRRGLLRIFNWFIDFELLVLHLISLHVPFSSLRKITFRLSGAKIGKGTTIHMGCKFFNPSGVTIGEDTVVGADAFLDGRAPLTIGGHVDIASEVMIYNSEHDINDEYFKAKEEKVEIGDYVFIGPRVIILPGVKIGKGAVVAAGAVVTEDVADFSIVGGVPAKVIGERQLKDLKYKLGRARLFQ